MKEDEWIREAMMDDLLVVELMMRFRQSKDHASLPAKRLVAVLPEWGMRQPRSRQILRCNSVQVKKEGESTRDSPTTPLSWSGGTSFSGSGTVDGYEESSCPVKRRNGVRSKVISTGENNGRRSRKKKTFAELKEEESLLLKERMHLKKELARLRTNYEAQRTWNVSLKKMKIDLQLQSVKEEAAHVELMEVVCDVPNQIQANSVDHSPSTMPKHDACGEADSCRIPKDGVQADNFFVLPDLNLPFDEDSNSEVKINGRMVKELRSASDSAGKYNQWQGRGGRSVVAGDGEFADVEHDDMVEQLSWLLSTHDEFVIPSETAGKLRTNRFEAFYGDNS
ncbi:hypothetical protein NE237_026308 [Protea cynaroides]|uniref:BZIP domain-containing protein n=1 Tax=Protea cynaroides TaxID=273540 RepID=A0A9Q0H3I3_9MAGN|nr:hypothetical protein NE237_026308 [Protea cynaroides]